MISFKLLASLLLYVVLSTYGLYKIKQSLNFYSIDFFFGFAAYGSGFILWLYMLKKFPLSIIFPLCACLLLIGTQAIGYYLLNEAFSIKKAIGVCLAIIAVLLLSIDMTSEV